MGKRVYDAILRVAAKMSELGISKDRKNQNGQYNFRGIDDVINALSPLYVANKLLVLPEVLERTCDERHSKSGAPLFYVTVKTRFVLVSVEDESQVVVGPFYGEAMDSSDKATNKAMSAAYKYFAFQTFAIPTEADDADAESHEPVARPAKAAPRPARALTECSSVDELRAWVRDQVPTLANEGKTAKRAWFLGTVEVAERLGVSAETVKMWCGEFSKKEAA